MVLLKRQRKMEENDAAEDLLRPGILGSTIRAISVVSSLQQNSSQDADQLEKLERLLWLIVSELKFVERNKSGLKVSREEMRAEIDKLCDIFNVSEAGSETAEIATETTEDNGTSELEAEKIQLLIERIKKTANNLIFGPGDIWSRLIHEQVVFNQGRSCIVRYEQTLQLAAEILAVRMEYIENARKSVIRQANEEYVTWNLMELPLTDNMDKLDPNDDLQDTDAEGEIDDAAIVQAHQECKNESTGCTGKWEDLVKLSREKRLLVQSMMYQVAAMRVERMCPISTLMESVEVKGGDSYIGRLVRSAREFLDRELPNWEEETYTYTVADALDRAMIYLLDGTSAEQKEAACNLVMLISKVLPYDKFRPYFAAAAAESMNTDIRQFVHTKLDDLPVIALGDKSSHFVGEEKDKVRERRRKKCVRCHLTPIVLNFRCHITPDMAFGACCITVDFVNKSLYTCLHKDNIPITPDVLKSLVTKGAKYSKVFKKDFILLDLQEGTTQSIDRLKKFFGLRSV